MTEKSKTIKRTILITLLILVPVFAAVIRTAGQREKGSDEDRNSEKWEYLAVAGSNSTNFSPTGNSAMRKQESSFGREAFVLETQLDKLGMKGWELVSVAGQPNDPVYYFKRRK